MCDRITKWLKQKNFNCWRGVGEFIVGFATIVTAFFSAFFGWQIYKLNNYELKSNLQVSDLILLTMDGDGKVIKRSTEDEVFPYRGKVSDLILGVKLKNNGKENVVVNLKKISSPTGNMELIKKNESLLNRKNIIPSGKTSPLLYGIDIFPTEKAPQGFFTFDYIVEYASEKDQNEKNELKFSAECNLNMDDSGPSTSSDPECSLILIN